MSSETTGSTKFYEILAWLEANKKPLAIGVGAALLLGFAVYFMSWRSHQRELEANDALFGLGLPLQVSSNKPPPTASEYLKVAASYAGTRAGERALLNAAGALVGENRYGEAMIQFKKFQTDYPNSPAQPIAALGVAACLEGLDKLNEALAAYKGVISRYPDQANQAKLAVARVCEALNQPTEALKYYKELTSSGTRSVWSAEGMELMNDLLRRRPELEATNLSPPSAMAPSLSRSNPPAPAVLKSNPAAMPKAGAAALPGTNASKTPGPNKSSGAPAAK